MAKIIDAGYFSAFFDEETKAPETKEVKVEKSKQLLDEVTETVRISGLRSIVSNSTAKQKTETHVAETKKVEPVLATRVMNTEEAKTFFADYARALASQNRRSLSSFLADPIIQVNEGKITFTVGSKNVAKDIEDETMKIIKNAAEKGWIITEIVTLVDAIKVSDYQVFTPKQQYDVLAKEFPVLKDFEARFNLDFDA